MSKTTERRVTRKMFKDIYSTCKRNKTMPLYYGAVLRYAVHEIEPRLKKVRENVEHLEQLVNNLKDQDNELQSK